VGDLGDGGIGEEFGQPFPDFIQPFSVLPDAVSKRKIYAIAFGYGKTDADNVRFMGVQSAFSSFLYPSSGAVSKSKAATVAPDR